MSAQPDDAGDSRLDASREKAADAIRGCIKTALRLPELVVRGQGQKLSDACTDTVARGPRISATCASAAKLARIATARAGSLEAVATAGAHLASAAARLDAALSAAEAALATRPPQA